MDGISVAGLALNDMSIGDLLGERYLGEASSAAYLIRPDQHVAARWRELDLDGVQMSVRNAVGKGDE